MAEDLARVSERVGIDLDALLPVAKGDHRGDRKPASEVLSSAQKQALYARDSLIFDGFNYAL